MNYKRKILFVGFSFFVSVLLFVVFVLLPLFQTIAKDSARFLEQRVEITKVASYEQNIKDFKDISVLHATDLELIENLFINPETPINFIEFLEKIAEESAFDLKIVPDNPSHKKGDQWPYMSFKLSSEGTYPNFILFLKKLEVAPYILEIKNTTVTKFKAQSESRNINFSIMVEVATTALRDAEK